MVTNNNDWGDLTKETTANYCYDLQTGASGTASNQNTDITNSQVKNILVQNESGFTETSSWQVKKNGKYPDWVIVWVNTGGSIYTSDIVIFNLNDPQTTYKKIATGAYVSWY